MLDSQSARFLTQTMFTKLECSVPAVVQGVLTYPYHYCAHPLVKDAAQKIRQHLDEHARNQAGRLVAVLVCRLRDGSLGFISACDQFDCTDPFFEKTFWQQLPAEELKPLDTERIEKAFEDKLNAQEKYLSFKEAAQTRREHRQQQRMSGVFNREALIASSQFDSGELERLKLKYILALQAEEAARSDFQHRTHVAVENEWKRRLSSIKVQNKKNVVTLLDLLSGYLNQEDLLRAILRTALPALFNSAYSVGAQPIAMGQFWWGPVASFDARSEGTFYAFAKERHEKLLDFFLEGQTLEKNRLAENRFKNWKPEIVYEDDDIVAFNKPAGMLSVPGKLPITDLYSIALSLYPQATGPMLLHRLDMATSGVVLFAKNKQTHKILQSAFSHGSVRKRYIALLEKAPENSDGEIDLPLCLNPYERPRQMVEYTYGKPASTIYKLLNVDSQGRARVAFYPKTGRTHQLRMHAAHAEGLNAPIVGDELYGHPADRLYLHAETIRFIHPSTGQLLTIEAPCPF